jgi:hypothetical protein
MSKGERAVFSENWSGLFTVNSERGITLTEQRQSSRALKRQTGESHVQLPMKKVRQCAKGDQYDETFALLPSLLQGHASLDRVLPVFLIV